MALQIHLQYVAEIPYMVKCLYVARNMTKWPLKRGVRLWEVKNVMFVCSQEHDQVSAQERCPLMEG